MLGNEEIRSSASLNARQGGVGRVGESITETKSDAYRSSIVGEAALKLSEMIKAHILSKRKPSH